MERIHSETIYKDINEFDYTIKPYRKGFNYYQWRDIEEKEVIVYTKDDKRYVLNKSINVSSSDDVREYFTKEGNVEEQLNELQINKDDIKEIVVITNKYGFDNDDEWDIETIEIYK